MIRVGSVTLTSNEIGVWLLVIRVLEDLTTLVEMHVMALYKPNRINIMRTKKYGHECRMVFIVCGSSYWLMAGNLLLVDVRVIGVFI